jgi:hypothetical protein
MPPHRTARAQLTRDWLAKVHEDLRAAEFLATAPTAFHYSVAFHCQQAAEKALKAYLTWHNLPFRRTHDLAGAVAAVRGCGRKPAAAERRGERASPVRRRSSLSGPSLGSRPARVRGRASFGTRGRAASAGAFAVRSPPVTLLDLLANDLVI